MSCIHNDIQVCLWHLYKKILVMSAIFDCREATLCVYVSEKNTQDYGGSESYKI